MFRPALVKALASNPNVKLKYKYPLDGSVITLSSNDNVSYLLDIIKDPKFDLPIILVAESGNQPIYIAWLEDCHSLVLI